MPGNQKLQAVNKKKEGREFSLLLHIDQFAIFSVPKILLKL
jgi:hypothetical protein